MLAALGSCGQGEADPARAHRTKFDCGGEEEGMSRIDYLPTGSTTCVADDARSYISDDSHFEEIVKNGEEGEGKPFDLSDQQVHLWQITPRPEVPGGAVDVKIKAEAASLASVAGPPGLSMPEGYTLDSLRVALHASGGCEPCAWYWKPQGCFHGRLCKRCHLCPQDEIAKRRRAKKELFRTAKKERQLRAPQQQQPLQQEPAVNNEDSEHTMRSRGPAEITGAVTSRHEQESPCSDGAVEIPFVKESGSVTSTDDEPTRDLISEDSDAPDEQIEHQELATGLTSTTQGAFFGVSGFSLGAALHSTGECEPCAWFWKPQGCHHGPECRRCHLCQPEEGARRRRAKKEAMRAEKRALKDGRPAIMTQRSETRPALRSRESSMLHQAQPMRAELAPAPAGFWASGSAVPSLTAPLAVQAAALALVPAPPGLPTPEHLLSAAELLAQAGFRIGSASTTR